MGWQTVVHKREDLFKTVWAEPLTHGEPHDVLVLGKSQRRLGAPVVPQDMAQVGPAPRVRAFSCLLDSREPS